MQNLTKLLVIGLACVILPLVFGFWVASENYFPIALVIALSSLCISVVAPGYSFMIAFGLLCPFIVPLPFFYSFPVIALMLGLISFKFVVRGSMGTKLERHRLKALPISFIMFFGWVIFRYCLNPVMPGLALGLSANISGFRFYLNYAVCLFLCLMLGLIFIQTKNVFDVLQWLRKLSVCFILFFIPFIFSKSSQAADFLNQLGVYVALFDNGFLRLVVLPTFGLILISLGLLPTLCPSSTLWRRAQVALGVVAVVLSGTRSGVGMALAVFICVPLQNRKYTLVGVQVGMILLAIATSHFIGENFNLPTNIGLLRPLSLINSRLAENSDASATMEWRMIRWNRAIEEIKQHPIIGRGYGGLDNVLGFRGTYGELEAAQLEMDIATGGIHNGYLASALTLGIPAAAIFIFIFLSQLKLNWKNARANQTTNPLLSDLHSFIFANLVASAVTIYIGTDLNNPMIWFFLILGPILLQIHQKQSNSKITRSTSPVERREAVPI